MRPCLNRDKFPSWLYHGSGCRAGTARGAAQPIATGPSPCSSCCPWTLFVPSTPSRLRAPFVPIKPFAQLRPKWSCSMVKVGKKISKIVGEKWNSGEFNFFKPQLMSHIWLPAGPHKQLDWHVLGGCWCLVRGNTSNQACCREISGIHSQSPADACTPKAAFCRSLSPKCLILSFFRTKPFISKWISSWRNYLNLKNNRLTNATHCHRQSIRPFTHHVFTWACSCLEPLRLLQRSHSIQPNAGQDFPISGLASDCSRSCAGPTLSKNQDNNRQTKQSSFQHARDC